MSQSLAGKTALATGGSRGIGRSIAERLAEEGALVALTYNASNHGADETVAAIEKAGGSAFAVHADPSTRSPSRTCSLDSTTNSRSARETRLWTC